MSDESNKQSLIIYHSWAGYFEAMSPEDCKAVIIGLIRSDMEENKASIEVQNPMSEAIYENMLIQVDNNRKKYQRRCEKNRSNINKRWNTNVYD